MNRRFLKICSWFLCFVLLVNMLPMSIFAEEFRETLAASGKVTETETAEATIVDEITENRTEYTKEFLLSNGLRMATVYATPVHYQEGGSWKEIDNTLTAKTSGVLTNTAGIWDVSFPQQLTKENYITIQKDGYTLSFGMASELRSTGLEVATAESNLSTAAMTEQAETLAVGVMQNTTAKIEQIDLSAAKEAAEFEEAVPQKLQSRLKYDNVFSNTDVTYDLDSNTVKESIIIQSFSDTLRGYRYTLNVGTLRPVLEEDGQITFYDEKQENVVMVMPAPYLLDNAQEMNTDIQVRLTGSGSTYTLTYILPRQWLAAEERQWPVILDPVVVGDTTRSNIRDVTVCEGKVYDNNWGMLMCGHSKDNGVSRFYVKYDELPVITSSDVVISAAMSICKYTDGSDMLVEAHKVNSTWDSVGMTWANKPGFSSYIDDYAIVNSAGYYSWDITDIVRQWYADANTGVMFKLSNASEAASTNNYRQFYSSDYGSYRPILTIMFRNNNGLESYWDYLSASAGRSGTGYVNKYTGNLTWTRDLIGFGGNRMPVSITQTYNANDAIAQTDENNSNDTAGHSFGMGRGWRTNYHQLVYQWSEDNNYYIWEDSDGTDHYFEYSSSNTYKDEDGLELTLTTNGSGTQKYCIKNKNGECWYFDTNGRLTQITNNQATKSSVNITYKNATSRLITQITDGVGRKYVFSYVNDYLANIVYTGTDGVEDARTSFVYTGYDQIYTLDNDGKKSIYTYDSNGLLTSVQDIDGYKLSYTYNTVSDPWQPYRITSVTETDGSAQGSALTLAYAHNQTTVTDHNGNAEIYQFNNLGNVVTVQDDEGRAVKSEYAKNRDDDAGKGNQLKVASKLQNTVANLLKDSSFETANPWTAHYDVSASLYEDDAYLGKQCLKIVSNANRRGVYSQMFTVGPGETVTFSAYVKSTAKYQLMLQREVAANTYVNHEGDFISSGDSWTRQELSYTNDSDQTLNMWAFLRSEGAGTFYMDCVQVEKTETASRYNLIENGDFSQGGSPAYRWVGTSLTSSDKIVTDPRTAAPNLSTSVFSITGNPTGKKQLSYTFNHSGAADDCYVFGGWAWSDKPMPEYNLNSDSEDPSRFFQIRLTLTNTDNTTTEAVAKFNPGSRRWQYTSAACAAQKAYKSITLTIEYNYNANVVWFDGIQLFKEAFGTSYTYDDKGNIISTQDLQNQTTRYEYDTDNNLTGIFQDNKAKMSYTYDNYHNVKTAKSEEEVEYKFEYDTYGNQTKAGIIVGDNKIEDWFFYSADGNRLTRVQDRLNRDTYYGYDEQTNELEWVQYPTNTAENRTNYTYDAMYRTTKVSAALTNPLAGETQSDTDNPPTLTATYTYTDDYLTKVQTASTAYNFTYGNFGLRQSVKVGDTDLATYTYTDNQNKYLQQLKYGNQDSINYTYDDKGRLLTQTYEDGDTLTHTYDNSGNLATVTDSATGRKTTYYYDLTDRLMKTVETGTDYLHSVEYTYDAENNLTQQVENINGTKRTVSYTYDKDNRVTDVSDGTVSVHYTYDSYGRVSKKETKNGGTDIKTETYTFQDLDTNPLYTSDQVSTYVITIGSRTLAYYFTYDDNGNITQVEGPENVISYTYDSANQLVREENHFTDEVYTWGYDTAGNITEKSYFATEAGELVHIGTTDYTYSDGAWGDLLTNYNGQAITYDQIGNPTKDGIWNYTWEHGRQLASMSNGSTTWSYTYDADGLRTGRTNGTDTYSYVYNGGSLSKLTKGSDTLYFTYDANGTPLTVNYNGTTYYYITNLQGDVTSIIDAEGKIAADYQYNAWGNPIAEADESPSLLETLNPLRYRGYVYDQETGLYYLQSRYYNPEMGRFINGDVFASTGQGLLGNNMFAYCGNNPIRNTDSSGALFFTALGAATGFIGGFVTAAISNAFFGTNTDAFSAGIHGAVGGAIAGAGVDAAVLVVGTFGTALPAVALAGGIAFLAGGIGNAYCTYATSNGQASDKDMSKSFLIGGIFNTVSFGLSSNAAASTLEGVFVRGAMNFTNNFNTGTSFALGTSVATAMATTDISVGNRIAERTLRHKLSVKEKRLSS